MNGTMMGELYDDNERERVLDELASEEDEEDERVLMASEGDVVRD
jgi:hypothetical protein